MLPFVLTIIIMHPFCSFMENSTLLCIKRSWHVTILTYLVMHVHVRDDVAILLYRASLCSLLWCWGILPSIFSNLVDLSFSGSHNMNLLPCWSILLSIFSNLLDLSSCSSLLMVLLSCWGSPPPSYPSYLGLGWRKLCHIIMVMGRKCIGEWGEGRE